MFEKKFDVVIIGSGSGMNVGARAISHGLKVAVVEHGLWGGLCLNRGCIPSKMLIFPADVVRMAQGGGKLGVTASIESVDFKSIMQRTRRHVREEREPLERSAQNHPKLTWYRETGEFVGDHTLKVGDDKIKGKMIFIASGTRPLVPKIDGLEDVEYLTNDTVFGLDEKPERLLVIGGGYVGCEFAHFFSSVGCEVSVLEQAERLMMAEEPEISRLLFEEMINQMQVLTRHRVERVEQDGDKKRVIARNLESDEQIEIEGDQILVAAGRVSNADLLNPEETDVEIDDRGYVKVNEYLETTKDNIWAFGDAIGKHMYRHAANYEAEIAWNNAHTTLHDDGGHGGGKVKVDWSAVPHAVYSHPQIGSVGMTEKQARDSGYDIMVGTWDYSDTAKGSAMGDPPGFVKAIVERDSMKILGCHIIGYCAPVMVQEVVNVMNCEGGTAMTLLNSMHIHPALTEIVQNAFGSIE